MSIAKYLTILGVCTGLCWIAWVFVLILLNPATSGWIAFLAFYASLGLALIGTFSILGFVFRGLVLKKDEIANRGVNIASRQSIIFTLLVLVSLALQSQRYLTWWNLLIIVIFASFIELFFVSYKKFNK
jgi:hypothetical protein